MALELKWNQPSSLDTEQTVLLWGEKNTTYIKTNVKNKPVSEQVSQLWHHGGCAFTSL